MEHQEDKDQIENLQTQELGKVKHLVLLREQELAEKSAALKETTQQLDKLRNEVTRLRRQEELLSDVQVRCRMNFVFLLWHVFRNENMAIKIFSSIIVACVLKHQP